MNRIKHILIVDDDAAVRSTLCENLRESGFDVSEAENGIQGLAMINRCRIPNLVITDIIMPGMDGLQMIEEIRKINFGIPIFVISGGARIEAEDFLKEAQAQGANAVFPKPIDFDRLEATIQQMMK